LSPADDPQASLAQELRSLLLAELGAHAIYGDLARRCGDPQLARLLSQLHDEQAQQVRELREVMQGLGLRPRAASRRRRVLAWLLASARPLIGERLVLRLCAQAADHAARIHATTQLCLRELGRESAASTSGRLSERRRRHALALSAWVENG
jgi:hypothetical protein